MSDFFTPVADLANWTLGATTVTIPAGLRYAGYTVQAVDLSRAAAADVRTAARGIVRQRDDGSHVFVELQVNSLAVRRAVAGLPGGLPTFYYIYPLAAAPTPVADHAPVAAESVLHTTTAVTLAIVAQDRIVRDPAYQAAQIAAAITAGGGDATTWQPFATALDAALNSGSAAPVYIQDHRGMPVTDGAFDLVFSGATHRAVMTPADAGNLQATVARLNTADPVTMPLADLWSSENSFTLRPVSTDPEFDFQLVRLEDGLNAATEIPVDPVHRHIHFTNLHAWLAKQCATHADPTQDNLARFRRGNRIRPLVNGPAFFDDLFRELHDARNPNGSFHLAGWSMFPETALTTVRDGDPADLKVTLAEVAAAIGAAGGASRFLPAGFIHLNPGTSADTVEVAALHLLVMGLLTLDGFGLDFARTDGSGALVLMGLIIGNAIFVQKLMSSGGEILEPHSDAVDVLDPLTNALSKYAHYPAHIDDQVPPPNPTDFPFNVIFDIVRHFGIYHQKLSVVRNSGGYVGYCGGIDLNPDRLDDAHHLAAHPYHDLHCRVEGPAVRDLALTFEHRWLVDGDGTASGLTVPAVGDLATPGNDIVQVARTYFQPADAARQLPFAPQGDRTIADSILAGIAQAREFIYIEDQYFTPPAVYRTALIDKVRNGEIRKLIAVMPALNDQAFGETVRNPFVTALKQADADAGGGIVHLGFPRRHFTVPDNTLRAASGKVILQNALANSTGPEDPIFLAPKARLPLPPFWIAVDGELIYIYDESTHTPPDDKSRGFQGLRGNDTNLVAPGKGPKTRAHEIGAAATIVHLDGIYVHAKMMIVDDVFLSVGSANLNRRGFWHDGEINIFSLPGTLKTSPNNPIRRLRHTLWAEMLDLPPALTAALVDDPVAGAAFFGRNPLAGNRFVDKEAEITNPLLGSFTGGDAIVGTVLQALATTVLAIDHQKLFDIVIDPTTGVESRTC